MNPDYAHAIATARLEAQAELHLDELRYVYEKATGLLRLARMYGMEAGNLEARCLMLANDILELEREAA